MKLSDVANSFNNMLCSDAYTGEYLFNGQLGLYDDTKRDSETAERRVISLAPEVELPPRRVIAAAGTRFILGHANPDDYRGSTIRVGYVAQEAPSLAQVRTLDEACLGLDGFSAYAGRAWVKDLAYSEQSSVKTPEHHIHFSVTEVILRNHLVLFEGRLNVVRALNYGAGGTIVAACEEMHEPSVGPALILAGAYDPVQDTFAGVSVSATVVRMRWQSLFAYLNALAPKFEPGDIQIAIARSTANIVAGMRVVMSDGTWVIESAVAEGSVWLCRAVLLDSGVNLFSTVEQITTLRGRLS